MRRRMLAAVMATEERYVPAFSHDRHVSISGPEEAGHGVADFWGVGDRLFGLTHMEEGELVLRIAARSNRDVIVVNAGSLGAALAQAKLLLESS